MIVSNARFKENGTGNQGWSLGDWVQLYEDGAPPLATTDIFNRVVSPLEGGRLGYRYDIQKNGDTNTELARRD